MVLLVSELFQLTIGVQYFYEYMFSLVNCGIIGFAIESVLKGGWHISWKGGDAMEVKDALKLMFMFGMFILALLSYLKKK